MDSSVFKTLIPLPVPVPTTPQCCVPYEELLCANHYRKSRAEKVSKKGLDPAFCSFSSKYRIKGKPYCAKHAGQAALRLLVELEKGTEQ